MYETMNEEVLKKEFEKFLDESPFASIDKNSQTYIGMYGAYMGGYIQCQKEVIKKYDLSPTAH